MGRQRVLALVPNGGVTALTVVLCAGQRRDRDAGALRCRRHLSAHPLGVVLPAVVRALDVSVDDAAQGEGARTMRALVLDTRSVAVLVSEENPRLAKELDWDEHVLCQPLQQPQSKHSNASARLFTRL